MKRIQKQEVRSQHTPAPDLLEYLERLVNFTNHPLFHEQTELTAWPDFVSSVKAAIAKAQGGAR